MRILFALILAACMLGSNVPAQADEPFAPKLTPPQNIKEGSPEYLGVMMLKAAVVPAKSTVGVPAYPGAVILQSNQGLQMEINDSQVTCAPYIKMLSSDDGQKIVSFYKERLDGYQYMNKFGGMIQVFWKGGDTFDPMDMEQRCKTPAVQVSDGALFKDMMPEAKSVIEITYTP